jgi:hypothetical protein
MKYKILGKQDLKTIFSLKVIENYLYIYGKGIIKRYLTKSSCLPEVIITEDPEMLIHFIKKVGKY